MKAVAEDAGVAPGRWIEVAPSRFPGWIGSFGGRHGATEFHPLTVNAGEGSVTFTAPDAATARCHPPFPHFSERPGLSPLDYAHAITEHALANRVTGVLLVRLGGYAVGVFTGSPPALAASRTGSRLVHGRSAAGGWSQHRFARRREKQATEARHAAADAAIGVWGSWGGGLDAVVLGGDKRAIAELRRDARLAPYLALAVDRFLTVPDPKQAVLAGSPRLFLAIRIWLTEPQVSLTYAATRGVTAAGRRIMSGPRR